MQMITSEAGTRLAKARHEYLRALRDGGSALEQYAAKLEYEIAADKVADELIEQGFHDLDGGEG